MIGIICKDELAADCPSLFYNFRLGLQNYLDTEFKNIECKDDLHNIDILIIVDEHNIPHVDVWKNDEFIARLNELNIKTLVFNFEKILSNIFPWNQDHQNVLETIKNLHQLVSDVDDRDHARTFQISNKKAVTVVPHINKQLLSKDTKLECDLTEKKDRILFIGQSDSTYHPNWSYSRRFNILNELKARDDLPLDIHITGRKMPYKEYLTKLASYKFILNPLGTGDFINMRFYEALKLGCVPIQQVTGKMISVYSELSQNICTTFKTADEVQLPNETDSFNDFTYYLEDYFKDIDLGNYLH
tara:strand:- start:706 stop:1608 length:903 start_codon:yes stop_codon:yes gene_type:complete